MQIKVIFIHTIYFNQEKKEQAMHFFELEQKTKKCRSFNFYLKLRNLIKRLQTSLERKLSNA